MEVTIFLRAAVSRSGKEKEACRHGTPTGSKENHYVSSIVKGRGDVKMTAYGTTQRQIGVCGACGEPIYEGDVIRKDGEHLLHCDKSCLEDWMHTNWSVEELLDAVGVGEAFAYEDL